MAYRKIILFSLLFSFIVIGIDRCFFARPDTSTPNPETHIRVMFFLLQHKHSKIYQECIMPEKMYMELNKKENEKRNPGSSKELSMERLVMALMIEKYDYKEYMSKPMMEDFKNIYKSGKEYEGIDWENARITNITWKLSHDKEMPETFRCNSKIYFKSGNRDFCLKYKYMIYYKGVWYPGSLVDLEDITPENDFPLNFFMNPFFNPEIREPNVNPYGEPEIPEYHSESPTEEAIDAPAGEKMEED